jgi:hypothetical protein
VLRLKDATQWGVLENKQYRVATVVYICPLIYCSSVESFLKRRDLDYLHIAGSTRVQMTYYRPYIET